VLPMPTTPRMNLAGLTNMTAVMAAIANKPSHVGAAYRIR